MPSFLIGFKYSIKALKNIISSKKDNIFFIYKTHFLAPRSNKSRHTKLIW